LAYYSTPIYRTNDTAQKSLKSVLNGWLALNIPPEKLIFSTSLAIKTWYNTQGVNHTFHQQDQSFHLNFSTPLVGAATIEWDPFARASYAYDEQNQRFHSFETEQSLKAKSRFARINGLGGILLTDNAYIDAPSRLQSLNATNQLASWPVHAIDRWYSLTQTPNPVYILFIMSVLLLGGGHY
jgi:GH18 family chitinase